MVLLVVLRVIVSTQLAAPHIRSTFFRIEELTKMIKVVRCKTDSKYVRPLVILYKEETKLIENLRKSEFKDSIQEEWKPTG